MTAEHFETTLDVLISARPFKPFTIELNTGQRIEIDHRGAILWADASAIFREGDGVLVMFEHDSVNQIINASAHSAPGKRKAK